ncbi:molybdopterin converting factor subunit 1 [Caballeronia udeis]|uniref:Molybdopterin synthase sulfur carrier subunit n=1 Tax=Caballeronia udeis TaxID=1232866 RepID=A0A158GX37_9BURK|nr:molybdopterin converting factor subunit 1 [Caballeronia udeis]SAL36638.1 molybdopterin converting factor subunit 1 [Caballeronia udeis]
MKIEVKYFASIREATGLTHETVTLNAGATLTVDSLRTLLAQRSSGLREALATGRPVRAAVDHVMRTGSFELADGCEVAFFPPVTGG